jgi:hypothetical protein
MIMPKRDVMMHPCLGIIAFAGYCTGHEKLGVWVSSVINITILNYCLVLLIVKKTITI